MMLEIAGDALGLNNCRGGVSFGLWLGLGLGLEYVIVSGCSDDLSMPRTGSNIFLDLGAGRGCGVDGWRGMVGDCG